MRAKYCLISIVFLASLRLVSGMQDDFFSRMHAAQTLEKEGHYAGAETILLAVGSEMKSWGTDDQRRGMVNHILGSVYHSQRKVADAERCYFTAIGIWERSGQTVENVNSLINLATLYIETAQYGKAGRLHLTDVAARLENERP